MDQARKICCEMLRQRGYIVADEEVLTAIKAADAVGKLTTAEKAFIGRIAGMDKETDDHFLHKVNTISTLTLGNLLASLTDTEELEQLEEILEMSDCPVEDTLLAIKALSCEKKVEVGKLLGLVMTEEDVARRVKALSPEEKADLVNGLSDQDRGALVLSMSDERKVAIWNKNSDNTHLSDAEKLKRIKKMTATERAKFAPLGERMCVFFVDEQFGIPGMKTCMSEMNVLGVEHCIVVVGETITHQAKAGIQDLNVTVEILFKSQLQTNITKHRLQPSSFSRLSDEDAKEFLKKYGRKSLPKMRSVAVGDTQPDPIVKFYHFRPNDVIKVTRKSGHVTFRLVV